MGRVCTLFWPLLMALVLGLLVLSLSLEQSLQAQQQSSATPRAFHPFDPDSYKGDLNYGIIVDAGSSGSRAYVYVWPPHSGDPHELIQIHPLLDKKSHEPVVKKISPGISSLGPTPENATNYIRPILDYAASHIPVEKHKETSLFIMATAGLRLIPEEQSSGILRNLRENLPKLYSFIILDQHIEMISGKWEGIYSWIAVNYALGNFNHDSFASGLKDPPEQVLVKEPGSNRSFLRSATVGMIDMGGGSVQIAYEIQDRVPRKEMHLTQKVNLGCQDHDAEHEYRLYVTTFLGYGANSAIDNYEALLASELEAKLAAAEAERKLKATTPNPDQNLNAQDDFPKEIQGNNGLPPNAADSPPQNNIIPVDLSRNGGINSDRGQATANLLVTDSPLLTKEKGPELGAVGQNNVISNNAHDPPPASQSDSQLPRINQPGNSGSKVGSNSIRENGLPPEQSGLVQEIPLPPHEPVEPHRSKRSLLTSMETTVRDPCLPLNLIKTVHLPTPDPKSDSSAGGRHPPTSFTRKGVGNWEECVAKLRKLLKKDTFCEEDPCSINGVYQAPIPFARTKFFGFSEYWYSMQDVFALGGEYNYDIFNEKAHNFCATKWSQLQDRYRRKLYPRADNQRMRTQCIKSAWVTTVLHDGFGFSKKVKNFESVSLIKGQEVQWTLGAILYKLRYFPLREVQRLRDLQTGKGDPLHHTERGWWNLPSGLLSQLVLLLCMVVVLLAALRYFLILRRSRPLYRKLHGGSLPRNRSMWGYMMLNTEDKNNFIRVEHSDYVY